MIDALEKGHLAVVRYPADKKVHGESAADMHEKCDAARDHYRGFYLLDAQKKRMPFITYDASPEVYEALRFAE